MVNGLVVVIVGAPARAAVLGAVVGKSVVVSKQPPNHPYLTQEVVGASDVELKMLVVLVALVGLEVVVSSRQPHHPGVLQVEVLVGDAVDELLLLLDVVPSVPLLSKYFQLKQSTHSSSGKQGGTSS